MLVAGGAGAVGNAAIQLAAWAGARVISTVSSEEKAALATAAGAHHVVDYTEGDTAARIREIAPDGVDIVVEVAPAQNLALDLAVVRLRGTIAVYANNGGDQVTLNVRETFSLNVRLQFVLLYTIGDAALRAAAEDVNTAIVAGAFGVGEERGVPCTTSRSSGLPTPTRPSRTGSSARCSSTCRTTSRPITRVSDAAPGYPPGPLRRRIRSTHVRQRPRPAIRRRSPGVREQRRQRGPPRAVRRQRRAQPPGGRPQRLRDRPLGVLGRLPLPVRHDPDVVLGGRRGRGPRHPGVDVHRVAVHGPRASSTTACPC